VQDVSKRFDSGLQKEILELATRVALAAQQENEHQRRMSNDRLNAMGKKISTKTFEPKALVHFCKPPTQAQALATGRKVKHLATAGARRPLQATWAGTPTSSHLKARPSNAMQE
jgi:hypothetical protein